MNVLKQEKIAPLLIHPGFGSNRDCENHSNSFGYLGHLAETSTRLGCIYIGWYSRE